MRERSQAEGFRAPTRWTLPNSNWRTVDLIGVRLADKGIGAGMPLGPV